MYELLQHLKSVWVDERFIPVREMFFYFCSATLLAFLLELLKSSVAMQEQMLGGKGFLVIGYLLEKVRRRLLTMSPLFPNRSES